MSKEQATYKHWFDRWIFASFHMSAEALGLYRICFALFLLIWGVPNFSWLAQLPDSFFHPPTYSLANLFTGFPPAWFFQGLSLLIVLLCLLLLFGWFTRWVSVGLFVAIVVGKSFSFSFGIIGQDLIVWLVPLLMSFSNWGHKFSIDAQKLPAGHVAAYPTWPITMVALLLGFGMFSAGLPKLLGGWLDVSTHATRGHFFTQYYVIGDLKLLASHMITLTNPIVWEAMDWGAVFFEMSFLIAVAKPKWLRAYLLLTIVFHTTTFLVFNISFHFQYIVYLLFIHWGLVSKDFYARLGSFAHSWISPKGLLVAIVIYLPLYILSQQIVSQPGLLAPSAFILFTELLGWDYKIVMGTSALAMAYVVVIWQLAAKKIKKQPLTNANGS